MTSNDRHIPVSPQAASSDRLIGLSEMAARLTVSKRSVWRLVASGDLVAPVKIGHLVRWFEGDVQTYLDRKRQQRDSTRVALSRHRGES